MVEDYIREDEATRPGRDTILQIPQLEDVHNSATSAEGVYINMPSLVNRRGLEMRLNSSMRASVIQSMQQTYGNRAVQRSMGRMPVQRFGWSDVARVVGGPFAAAAVDPDKELAQARQMSAMVQQGQKSYEGLVDWTQGKVGGALHGAADTVKDIPVLGQWADMTASSAEQFFQFQGGVAKGAANLLGGVVNAAVNPVDTAKGLWKMGTHIPGIGLPMKIADKGLDVATGDKTLGAAFDETFGAKGAKEDANFWKQVGGHFMKPYEEAAGKGKYADMAGRGAFDIATMLVGVGEGSAAVKGAQGARGASVAGRGAKGADAARAAAEADAARIAAEAEAARAAKGAKEAAAGKEQVSLIGHWEAKAGEHMFDKSHFIDHYLGKDGYNILHLPPEKWNMAENVKFLEDAFAKGPVKGVTPFTRIADEFGNRIRTVWEIEQTWAHENGWQMGADGTFRRVRPH
jgi:hypothetical protein